MLDPIPQEIRFLSTLAYHSPLSKPVPHLRLSRTHFKSSSLRGCIPLFSLNSPSAVTPSHCLTLLSKLAARFSAASADSCPDPPLKHRPHPNPQLKRLATPRSAA
ncbi:hypothetical protein Salat_0655400 [Sesamum alatum]|uniref:Uncharacterized protein n=1 Tax=Sesamum alatum TaxID=300844 RepID=A0AAE1YQT3_9LAMI|nr:hypothetical protein Salat_0655400 [Sesamum alatum]